MSSLKTEISQQQRRSTKVVFLRVLLVTLRGNLRVLVPVPILTPKSPRILVRLKIPEILEIYGILESAKECEIPVRMHIGQGERLMEPNLYRIVPNLHIRATTCLPRGLIREPTKALEPERPPRAHLQGIHRVTTIPMMTTMTTYLNEAGLVGPRHRHAAGVGGMYLCLDDSGKCVTSSIE
jgi:hypothetical protein